MTTVNGIVFQNIKQAIAPELSVYDNAGTKLGEIDEVDRETGYFTVKMPPFADMERAFDKTTLVVPFRLITNIDPRELYLALCRDELLAQYANPPARSVVVEGAVGSETAVTSEPSGYDGSPMVVEQVFINSLRNRLTVGDHVLAADGVDLGTIKRYDSLTGWMLVEKGPPPRKHDVMVPVWVAAHVNEEAHQVRLVTSQADLQRMQHMEPANMVFAEADSPEVG
ncbi:MAG TPA: hypothetical protein VKX16_07545 [Chloroflexota bacterium]|nr:hypothetical protein [Chloroflexota bacterium]